MDSTNSEWIKNNKKEKKNFFLEVPETKRICHVLATIYIALHCIKYYK